MSKPTNKVAIVTGASRGIGAAVAKRLGSDGFAVVVDYSGNAEPAEALAREITGSGGHALAVRADVADPAAVRQLFEATEREFGGVDVLVNAAGIMPLSPLAEMDDATFDRVVSINLKGSFNVLREAAKRLRKGGRIINFSSSVVGLAFPNYTAYAATKAGVEVMTHILSKELRGREITANTVAPGPTATDLFIKGKPQADIDRLAKMPPLERLGEPKDIANAVSFLAGPDGAWVNGQTLRVNGGII